jgi:hypothetical protein
MSVRAELVRLGLRWFVKRKIGPATTPRGIAPTGRIPRASSAAAAKGYAGDTR